jgi:hypothetical protein
MTIRKKSQLKQQFRIILNYDCQLYASSSTGLATELYD